MEQIKQAHLLLAMFNALQPGVFALSGWDLVGALTLDRKQVAQLLAGGDTRWIHRSAYDLMDYRPDATESLMKMPRGISLYGSLPAQLADPELLRPPAGRHPGGAQALRHRHQLSSSTCRLCRNKAMLVMVHQLSDAEQVTVLNFSPSRSHGSVISEALVPGSVLVDMFTDEEIGEVDDLHSFAVKLEPHRGPVAARAVSRGSSGDVAHPQVEQAERPGIAASIADRDRGYSRHQRRRRIWFTLTA